MADGDNGYLERDRGEKMAGEGRGKRGGASVIGCDVMGDQ
jgi:hypothetical protein